MKKYLLLFFIFHLFLIFSQGVWTTVKGYWSYHHSEEKPDFFLLNIFKPQSLIEPYYHISGINTGYGFYGIKTSTKKYFRISFLDKQKETIETSRYFDLTTSNGIFRFEGFASKLANIAGDAEKLESSKDSVFLKGNMKTLQFKKNYVIKVLKWLGKEKAKLISNANSYKIELITIVPQDNEVKKTPEIYVIQSSTYPVQ